MTVGYDTYMYTYTVGDRLSLSILQQDKKET